jgi:hypothetical protein
MSAGNETVGKIFDADCLARRLPLKRLSGEKSRACEEEQSEAEMAETNNWEES